MLYIDGLYRWWWRGGRGWDRSTLMTALSRVDMCTDMRTIMCIAVHRLHPAHWMYAGCALAVHWLHTSGSECALSGILSVGCGTRWRWWDGGGWDRSTLTAALSQFVKDVAGGASVPFNDC